MKFLVITGRNGLEKESVRSGLEVVDLAKEVSELYQKKVLESSFAFMGGGSAFVLNANSTEELSVLIRSNALFRYRSHEIIPIADAIDFLKRFAELISSTESN
jgi:hypothetical protein